MNQARRNGVHQGLVEERLFIKTIVCGKGILLKKIDIKGRGRSGVIKVPKCSLRVTLEEKSASDFYLMMLQGKAPNVFANVMKASLFQSDADF